MIDATAHDAIGRTRAHRIRSREMLLALALLLLLAVLFGVSPGMR
jgi:hypothetical protein